MLKNALTKKEVVVKVGNKSGVLAAILDLLSKKNINIEAIAGYHTEGGQAEVMMITDNNADAVNTLKKSGYETAYERDVVVADLMDAVGALKHVAKLIADKGIDLKHIYGTSCSGKCPAKIVLNSTDNKGLLRAIK